MSNSKSLKNVFSYNSWIHAVSGATGGIVAMSTFYPIDTVRSRLQLEDPAKRAETSTFEIMKQLIQDEGFFTLYRGLVPVLQSLCISNFVYFYTFHTLKTLKGSAKSQSALSDLLLGALAGAINVLSTTPFWVVNTRLKMKGINKNNKLEYSNLIEGLIYVAHTEGRKGLWAGTIPSLMLVINPALQFMTYEAIKRHLTKVYGNQLPSIVYFGVGAMAKMVSTLITYPLQVVQTKLRHGNLDTMSGLPRNPGTLQMLGYLMKRHGFLGLYRGLEAKLLQTVLTAALMFATYEKIAKFVMSVLMRNKQP